MQIKPVFAALRRHRLASTLIAMEIALACAVLCNAFFLIVQRVQQTQIISGVDEDALAVVKLTGYDQKNAGDLNARVLRGLAQIPQMQSVSVINEVPFGESDVRLPARPVTTDAAGKHFGGVAAFYMGGPGSFKALGLRLVAGSAPQSDDFSIIHRFVPDNPLVWVTRGFADHLWPDRDPLGKSFWVGRSRFRVAGVIAHLAQPLGGTGDPSQIQWSVYIPAQPGAQLVGTYLLRANPGQLPRVLRDARAATANIAPHAALDIKASQTIAALREKYFQRDRAMAGILGGVIAAMLLVTALGIVGLASFWVAQRRKQIGIRRAVGATRGDILRYFQTENFLIVTFGIVLGMVLAYAINLLLMQHYELPRLPFVYLPIGAVALWVLGQLAVLAPALRAARVPPVVATRSV